MKNKFIYFLLCLVVVLAAFLRFYKLDKIPASLNWDEVAAGYNAYTIANWGADEYGNKFPIIFKSFADDKHPVHIYITSILVKIFGLSDYVVRSSSAAIGVLSVVALFFLVRELIKNDIAALISALFMAVSPYSIHFSRGLWENNFALFFLIAGLAIFYIGLRKKDFMLPLSFIFFGLSFFSYHSAKIVTPIVVLFVVLVNIKKIFENKIHLILIAIISLFFAILILAQPRILGFARMSQTKFPDSVVLDAGGKYNLILSNYKKYFNYSYLFKTGDSGPRASVKVIGEFYKLDFYLGLVGLIFLIYNRRWQGLSVILLWLLLSPIPGAFSSVDPSSIRGIFMIAPIIILSACGAAFIITITKNKWIGIITILLVLVFLSKETQLYLDYYLNTYPVKEAIEWQYGMKEIAKYSDENPNFYKMYVDNIRQQPYIYFLYYQKVSLPEFLKTVKYDESSSKSFNTVRSFGRYQFGGWNIIESYPNKDILYTITPSYYSGLRHASEFEVRRLIKYPDNSDAFYIVEGRNQ